jgi:hypothetical protein
MTGYICRKAGVPDIQTDSAEVKTAAELSGYICTSGELAEDTREAAEEAQTDFVCRKAGVPDIHGSDQALKTACELNGYICTSV